MKKKDPLKHFKYPVNSSIVKEVNRWYNNTRIKSVIKVLQKKNYDVFYADTGEKALKFVTSKVPKGSSIGLGGSMTVEETGILKALDSGDYIFYNPYKPGLSREEAYKIRSKGLTAEYYITGTNAITINGELINLDGLGNRVAGITYGPQKVIIIIGMNKFVSSIEEGIRRVKNYAAVLNCKRLNLKTPCITTGKCEDCTSPERICNHLLITYNQRTKGRVTIVIVGKELGF